MFSQLTRNTIDINQ